MTFHFQYDIKDFSFFERLHKGIMIFNITKQIEKINVIIFLNLVYVTEM